MECPKDVQQYTKILQEERVYVFLDDLDYSTKSRAPCYRCNHFRQLRMRTGDSSLAAAVAMAPFDSGFDPRQRRHLIRAHLVSQLIRVQLVLLD
ncbi:hypothetical protein CK203_010206 [Vitis vinifera]|uniref:Uncharacterized protein n=1 Tax=Vitis vinifera TaxID=29760 RepID=A0A438JXK1_VITVI|nr:hypothetical protein CK203_010206 [Vitis vinifera]